MRRMWTLPLVLAVLWVGGTPPDAHSQEKGEAHARVPELVAGNNAFAFDLFGYLTRNGKQENLVVSPYSISHALAMTYGGASGKTAAEMEKVLHFTMPTDEVHRAFASLLAREKAVFAPRRYELNFANALWGQKSFPFRKEYLGLVRERYRAEAREMDFAGGPDLARKEINQWVEERTKGKIQNLLQPGTVTPGTVLVLTNAVYLKGDWARPFHESQTRKDEFRIAGDRTVPIQMMRQAGQFRYLERDNVQLLDLPVGSGGISLLIVLPRKADGLGELQKYITLERLEKWRAAMEPTEVKVELPRFKIESQFDLVKALSDLGMPSAFGSGADFSRISSLGGLFISAVLHKAFLDVHEKGLEAAAATAVVFERGGPRPSAVFRADHPFLYLVRENSSGSILFMGRLVNPKTD